MDARAGGAPRPDPLQRSPAKAERLTIDAARTALPMLTSPANARVKHVVKLRQRRHRDREGRFIVEGVQELRHALLADFPVEVAFYCERLFGARGEAELVGRLAAAGVECQATNAAVFEKMSYRRTPDGLLAVATAPELTLAKARRAGKLAVAGRGQHRKTRQSWRDAAHCRCRRR